MKRALALAQTQGGYVSPNPKVGAVLVKNGKIVAEGAHQQYGGPHAEIVALKKAGSKARGLALTP
jgi:diaminohydroxyphosphoribosylaminopyrimidine deaminase/5-amino-6-(5-phosphoribosylamino)uracil reductase